MSRRIGRIGVSAAAGMSVLVLAVGADQADPGKAMAGSALQVTAPNEPRPSFLRPGVRISYLVGSGFAPPANTTSTTIFSNSPTTTTTPPEFGASGSQVLEEPTITGVSATDAAVDVRRWGLDTVNNRLVSSFPSAGYLLPIREGGEYWISPARLAAMPNGGQGGVTVTRGNRPVNGRTYRVIQLASVNGAYTYDLDSGLLLFWGSDFVSNTGLRTVKTRMLLGTRQTRIPWHGQVAPPEVRSLRRIEFSGTSVFSADRSQWTNVLSVRLDVLRSDPIGLVVRRTTVDDPRTGREPNVSQDDTVFALPTLWIDPRTLSTLRAGQVLDVDPITRGRTTVAELTNNTITFAAQVLNETTVSVFELKSGLFVASRREFRLPDQMTITSVQRTSIA